MDTVDNEEGSKVFNSNSTVSRYACRILVERVPPYTARIYAAAFDTKRRIQLSVRTMIEYIEYTNCNHCIMY